MSEAKKNHHCSIKEEYLLNWNMSLNNNTNEIFSNHLNIELVYYICFNPVTFCHKLWLLIHFMNWLTHWLTNWLTDWAEFYVRWLRVTQSECFFLVPGSVGWRGCSTLTWSRRMWAMQRWESSAALKELWTYTLSHASRTRTRLSRRKHSSFRSVYYSISAS